MRSLNHFGFASLVGVALAASSAQGGGIPLKTLKELKAATVFIKVQFGTSTGKPIPATGSGFVLRVEGGDGYIATNSHVVTPLAGEVLVGNVKLVFHSGTPDEKTVEGQVVASDAVRDLAIVKVSGFKELPRPIPMDPDIEIGETMPVFAIGFPFGEGLALGKTNPGLTITKGTISALRHDERGDVNLVQIDAEVNPGNSGGPVVDDKGRLVGVAVSKLVKARTVGFAVPVKPLGDMLQGKVATVVFDTLKVDKGSAEVGVVAGLIDPLGKLKDVDVHFRIAGDLKDLPRADKAGKVPMLKDAETTRLKVDKGKAEGKLIFKGTGADKLFMAYQAAYVNGTEKTIITPGGLALIDFTQVVHTEKLTADDPPDGMGKPHKRFTHKMKPGKHYVIEMRSDPKDLDPRLVIEDSGGKLVAEDDGAGGLFDALVVFAPPKEDEYRLVASAAKGSGPFTVRVREETGLELGRTGINVNDKLLATDAPDYLMRSPSRLMNVILKKGKSYVIDMKSKDFDPYMRLENAAGAHLKYEDVGGGGHSTLLYTPFQDSIFRIVATSFDFKTGGFNLTVRETPAPKEHEVPADAGLTLAEKLTPLDPIDIVNGRGGKARCKVFLVQMKAGQKYQLDLSSEQFDPFLRLEDSRGRELAADDDSGGKLNARLVFTPKTDVVQRVIATQFDGRFGAFELSVRQVP